MNSTFLIQLGTPGYNNVTNNHQYHNGAWDRRRKDRDQGEIEAGDSIYFYCTGAAPQYQKTLAFRSDFESISPDKTLIKFGEIERLRTQLPRDQILGLVANGQLDEVFRRCGAQGFNIVKLEPETAAKLRELVETGEALPLRVVASPLEDLIETKLEDYIVENWSQIDFGSKLRLFVEDNEPVGQQYDTREIGIIDLLCEDEETQDIVVVELKRGRPSDQVIGQLARYMGWVEERIANGRVVRGIILAPILTRGSSTPCADNQVRNS